jgi:hypothetical protein
VYIWAKDGSYQHVENIFKQTRYSPDGKISSETVGRQIQFWTPSEFSHSDKSLDQLGDNDKWEHGVTPEKLISFQELLKKHSTGWRRVEVFGVGRSQPKPGLWWIVTVDESFDMPIFIRDYATFWNTKQTIYVEEPSVRGGYKEFGEEAG